MPTPSAEPARLAEHYRLALPVVPSAGAIGDQLGRGLGASLEFQDRRSYAPGDDVRHIDWRAFGRSDQLLVRVYREEVLPRIELIVDASRSMQVEADKAQAAVDLATLIGMLARNSSFDVHVLVMADDLRPVTLDQLDQHGLAFASVTPLPQGLMRARASCRPGALRVVISDFLFPHEARSLVHQLASPPATPVLLQILGSADAKPGVGSASRLIDSETGESVELVLDTASVGRYLERLQRLQDDLRTECRRVAGHFVTVAAERSLADSCLELAALGLLAAR